MPALIINTERVTKKTRVVENNNSFIQTETDTEDRVGSYFTYSTLKFD